MALLPEDQACLGNSEFEDHKRLELVELMIRLYLLIHEVKK
jgi:hypothetical protein